MELHHRLSQALIVGQGRQMLEFVQIFLYMLQSGKLVDKLLVGSKPTTFSRLYPSHALGNPWRMMTSTSLSVAFTVLVFKDFSPR